MNKRFFLTVLISGLTLSTLLGYAQDRPKEPKGEKEYVISTNDILEITVYGETDLSATIMVSQDGAIIYPLLGNIKAAGFTVRELEKNIKDLLAEDYLVNPQVSIFIKTYSQVTIFVLGQVKSPGSYQMKDKLYLTQAIAFAGGFTEAANIDQVKIIRTVNDEKETILVDASQILGKEKPDVEIKPNDTIMVGEYGRISIIGQVAKPGVYNLKKGLTVVEAIVLAGGFTTIAAIDATRIIRVENGEKQIIKINMSDVMKGIDKSKNIELQAGDTIVVPESFF
jgi:polysaccharide export outer membrane protein